MANVYPPAGWYPDPSGASYERYWDGASWTQETTTVMSGAPAPSPYNAHVGATVQPSPSNGYSIAAMALGGVAFLLFPVLFGPIAIILAAVAYNKKEQKAGIGMAVAITGTVVGLILGMAFAL